MVGKIEYDERSNYKAVYGRYSTSEDKVFAAGDSSTDLTFLEDATALRLVINRNDPALMCSAYAGLGSQGERAGTAG